MNPAELLSPTGVGLLGAVDWWIFSFSAVTVLVTIAMGFWAANKSKTASDFFVAGRGVSVGWNASAISGEYLSAASFMGVAGMVMSSGYDALWYPVCYACGYLFLLLFIAGPLRRFGAYTIPDFAEGRYDSPLFRKIAVIFVLCIGFFYTMPQMKGAGVTLSYIFPGLPYWVGVALVGAIITFNVALGGMKGITLVQAFQYWAKMFAISVPVFVLMAVYGSYGKQVGVNGGNIEHSTPNIQRSTNATESALVTQSSALEVQRLSLPEKAPKDDTWLNPFGPLTTKAAKAAKPKVTFDGELQVHGYHLEGWLPLGLGDANLHSDLAKQDRLSLPQGNPKAPALLFKCASFLRVDELAYSPALTNIVVSWSNTNALSRSQFLDEATSVLREKGIMLVLEGGKVLKAFLANEATIVPVDPRPYSLLYTYSLIIALVCGTAGLPHILVRFYTNPDGVAAKRTTMWVMILIGVFYVFPPVFGVMGRNLMPELYSGVGAKGTDKIVLELPRMLNEKVPMLGSILSGITCAGAFAAFMSTFSGLLVSMTGALAHDVYGRILRPKSTAADRMKMFKWCAVLIGGVAILLGSFVEKLEINFMVGQAFAIAASSYFPLLFMSVWWRGMTLKGAATGMLTGGVLAVIAISLTSFSTLAAGTDGMAQVLSVFKPLNAFWVEHPLIRILCEQPAIWAVPLAILTMIVVSKLTACDVPKDIRMKMLVLHAPEKLGLKQEYIQDHEGAGH